MNKHLGFWPLLFAALAMVLGMSQGLAQTKTTTQSKPAAPGKTTTQTQATLPMAPSNVWIKDPNTVMPMRKMTNAERRKAAVRNAARRGARQLKQAAPANQGVQQ